jgi:uncharacterized protein YjdB
MVIGLTSNLDIAPLRITNYNNGTGMSKSVPNVVQNQYFNVDVGAIQNFAYSGFSGRIGVALVSSSSQIKQVISRPETWNVSIPFSHLYQLLSFNDCRVTETILSDDVLRTVYSTDGGSTWKIMYGGSGVIDYLPVGDQTPIIAVSSVSLNTSSAALTIGGEQQLTATISPVNATNKNVTWSTSNNSVASVNQSGKVTANGVGSAIITVTTVDGGHTATCEVTVQAPLSDNANLSSLSVSSGSLSPPFNANTISYTVNVVNSVENIDISATPADGNATVSGDGNKSLNVGNNSFNIVVTAENGTAKKTYNINVVRAVPPSDNANLSELAVSDGTLTPAFSANTTSYTVDVDYSVTSIYISATADDRNASVSGAGNKSLDVGSNYFDIEVLAEDEATTKTYSIEVVRAAPIDVSSVSLNTESKIMTIGDELQLIATITPSNATNQSVTWSTSHSSIASVNYYGTVTAKAVGDAVITVTTDDGNYTATCEVTVLSNNANLSSLSVSPGALSPAFDADITSYTVNVSNIVESIDISATPADANVTALNGTGNKSLNVGNNNFGIEVTAENGTTKKTYNINVVRAAPPSSNANLSELAVSAGTLTPAFAANKTSYAVNVDYNVASIDISATAADANATVSGTGNKPLIVGVNNFDIEVHAEDGTTTKTYAVEVVRDEPVDVSSVSLNAESATIATGDKLQLIATILPSNASNQSVTWSTNHYSIASVTQSGIVTARAVGVVVITATTDDGNYKATCEITVLNANLSALTVSVGDLSPAFDADIYSYTVNVEYSVDSINISATADLQDATVSGTGDKPLKVGSNKFEIVVLAEDGTTVKTYYIEVIRAAYVKNEYLEDAVKVWSVNGVMRIESSEEMKSVRIYSLAGIMIYQNTSNAKSLTVTGLPAKQTLIVRFRLRNDKEVVRKVFLQ